GKVGGGGGGGGGGGKGGGGGGGKGVGGGGGGKGDDGKGKRRSDIRLKQDIVPLARLDSGIELYRFRYKGSDPTTYVGVMAQEVQTITPSAVSLGRNGYLQVDYDRLGLKFMTWDTWLQRHGAEVRPAN
ncbi:MAG TPA: tail fiber domain-containing protein, partial [Xanthobacteraceae bacterium]